jgi:hypothetical protein
MKTPNMFVRTMLILLSLSLLLGPAMAFAETGPITDFSQGKIDGKRDAKGSSWWFLVGCLTPSLLSLALPIAVFFDNPRVPADGLVGKSPEYILGYSDGYKMRARIKDAGYAFGGCLTEWIVIGIGYMAVNLAVGLSK